MKKCLVLLSGGIDSAVLLWWAKNKKWKLATLTFIFPGSKKAELKAARILRKQAGAKENYEINLSFLEKPDARDNNHIPHRNLMYYALAAALADKINARIILGGHHRVDGEIFKDARNNYLRQIDQLIQTGGNSSKHLLFPFIHATKKQIVLTGNKLKTPFQHTWSCSYDRERQCGKCRSCLERISGFHDAGIKDLLASIQRF